MEVLRREDGCGRHARGVASSLVSVCLFVSVVGCSSPADSSVQPLATSSGSASAKPALLTPEPVRTAPFPIDESGPAARGRWVLWERADFTKGSDNYFAQSNGGARIRINPRGTFGRDGAIDAGRVVYSQERIHRYRSTQTDIWQYDLSSGRRFRLPRQVNTRRGSELEPSLAGHYLLFRRQLRPSLYGAATDKVLLFNRARHVLKTLAVVHQAARDDLAPSVDAGQVNGRYATWSRVVWVARHLKGGAYYDAPRSRVVLYDVRSGVATAYPVRASNYAGSSAVSADGSLYYVRSAVTASADETQTPRYFVKRPLGGPPVVIAKLPPRVSVGQLFVDDRSDGSHRVYFTVDDGDGRTGHNDVYRITDPPPSS